MLFLSVSLFAASAAAVKTQWYTVSLVPQPLRPAARGLPQNATKTSVNDKGNFWGLDSNKNPYYCKDYMRCNPTVKLDTRMQFTQISHNSGDANNGFACGLGINGQISCTTYNKCN